ncbi:MAG: hypothetical protein G01um101493_370 [Microgenomates group bacterium Gr01-1014_93]|nr:MAG: hypothetical protein G01um101493_370 [Microgenomates group bacterium Gr01-1014_93]
MIFWLIVFVIIIFISAFLAYLSMKNFPQAPLAGDNGVFLVRSPEFLTADLLQKLKNSLNDQIISIERLFKGSKKALVIFGPKNTLSEFSELNLLELEDFTLMDSSKILVLDVSIKNELSQLISTNLSEEDQIWFQIVLAPKRGNKFISQTRLAIISENKEKQHSLLGEFLKLNKTIYKKPVALSSQDIFENFKKRTIFPTGSSKREISSDQILRLL